MYSTLRQALVLTSLALLTSTLHAQWPAQWPPPLGQWPPQPPQISGRVVRANSGAPIQGATIMLVPPSIHGQIQTITTDSNGHYQFRGVKDGSYQIVASARGFITLTYPRDTSRDDSFQRVDSTTALRGIDFELVPEETAATGNQPVKQDAGPFNLNPIK